MYAGRSCNNLDNYIDYIFERINEEENVNLQKILREGCWWGFSSELKSFPQQLFQLVYYSPISIFRDLKKKKKPSHPTQTEINHAEPLYGKSYSKPHNPVTRPNWKQRKSRLLRLKKENEMPSRAKEIMKKLLSA